jgi:alpha-tubulin suppressor-like RCC1 family protein
MMWRAHQRHPVTVAKLMGVSVVGAIACLPGLSPVVYAARAKLPKPVISDLTSTPATVASGGTTAVTASVAGALQCTLSSNKPIAELPVTFSCESGGVDRAVAMPANSRKKAVEYRLTLSADGTGGKAKAKTTVGVNSAVQGAGSDQRVAGGLGHTCAVLPTGHVECWGLNEFGELGDGTRSSTDTAVEVLDISNATQIATGGYHSCALLSTGHVECWGLSEFGRLGDGPPTSQAQDTPVEVLGISDATQIAAGGGHTCAVLSSGHIQCWGENFSGQLGDGTTDPGQDTPVEVLGISDATQVAAGFRHSCAVLSSGHVECWGWDYYGQLGNGAISEVQDTPVEVLGISDATQVAAGEGHSCAVLSSGDLKCWGNNESGQLGNGATDPGQDTPVEVLGIDDATQVAAGVGHSCAVLSSGHLKCWGENYYGQLGDGANSNSATPVEAHIIDATQVAAGEEHTCAVLFSGHLQCWGENYYGQLGDGTYSNSATAVGALGISDATQVADGVRYSCAVLSSGHVQCWGEDTYGQLGDGVVGEAQDTPVEVLGISDATQIAVAWKHSCVLLSSGHIECWGWNGYGQLGDGATGEAQDTPVEVLGISDATQVAAGYGHSCAALSTGHVECWGEDGDGQLGNGAHTQPQDTPVEAYEITNATQVAAGSAHTCAVLSTGHVKCWGFNRYGQLGDGTLFLPLDPVEVLGISDATEIAAGEEHSCAVLSTGHVECWGSNDHGQVGDGATDEGQSTPVEALDISDAAQVTGGEAHTCAVLSTGEVQCWGWNEQGQLGDGTAWSTTPTEVIGIP